MDIYVDNEWREVMLKIYSLTIRHWQSKCHIMVPPLTAWLIDDG